LAVFVLASAEGVAGITVGGAIVVALITAFTTNRRQREALTHDRELADVADLRALLDETAIVLEDAVVAEPTLLDRHQRDEWSGRIARDREQLWRLHARIMVRLGLDHALAKKLKSAILALTRMANLIPPSTDARDSAEAERIEAIVKEGGVFVEHGDAFIEAAAARVGTVVREGESIEDAA
jgi:hypothetical protein